MQPATIVGDMVWARCVILAAGLGVAAAQDVFLAAEPEAVNETRGSPAVAEAEAEITVEAASNWFTAYFSTQPEICLSIDNDDISQGAKVQAWTCVAGIGQQFIYYSNDSTLRAAHNPEYCVVTHSNNVEFGTRVQLWKCHEAGASKHWIASERWLEWPVWPGVWWFAFVPVGNSRACLGAYNQHVSLRDWATLAYNDEYYNCYVEQGRL
eukprot:TRINITY_DN3664_c0_g1_i1.p1 TRINITY_DN3664_c0_g1~~TRINITY_DN3664_c0_g1_i1.p1  ORF type:complete len:210 (+),score=27.43 TRINITY_DN3664_c0_g1_i1:46-675(+)